MRVLCAGDEFVAPEMFIEALAPQLGGDAEFVTHASGWPARPWECGEEVTEFAGDEAEVAELARDVDLVVTHLAPVTEQVLDAAGRLRLVATPRGGPTNVNVPAATRRGVPVVYLPGRNATAVAEFTVGMLLAGRRNIARSHARMQRGEWAGDLYGHAEVGPELAGSTVGLVGLGQVGARVAELLRAFGVRLLASDPYVDPDVASERGVELTDLDSLLARCDTVSLHARLTGETRRLINEATLGRMRRGSYLVNTARGELVDEEALVRALRCRHLSGAALDTYAPEPPEPEHPLLALPNVLTVSHLGGASQDVARRATRRIAAEVGRFLGGEPLQHCLNPAALPPARTR